MRRPLARATAACAASALALWAAVPAAAGEEAPSEVEGAATAGKHGSPGERTGKHAGTDSPASARSGEDRIETETSRWTYVDRAFPDQAYDDAETASVGTGRLEGDRVYTRRALFQFPVELESGLVDSAVLRVEVAWSYDCHSDAHLQLHRVDPFGTGTTWHDQPAERALLDTRSITGGRAACPVSGGVEFDATEAYRQAVHDGESHLHLRLNERGEAGTTAWRRFHVAESPPVLVIDHGTPSARGMAFDPPGPRHGVISGELSSEPECALTFSEDEVDAATGTDAVPAPGLVAADRARGGEGKARPEGRGPVDRFGATKSPRRRDGDALRRCRGPPGPATVGARSGHRSPTVDGGRHPTLLVSYRAKEYTSGGPSGRGPVAPGVRGLRSRPQEPHHRRTGTRRGGRERGGGSVPMSGRCSPGSAPRAW